MTEAKIADRYTYRVTWTDIDLSHVGTCDEFPSLSWLAESPDAAFRGILHLVRGCVRDMIANGEAYPSVAKASHSDGGERQEVRSCLPSPLDGLDVNVARSDRPPMAAIAARYEPRIGQIMIKLRCGLCLAFCPGDIQGLEAAKKADLKCIEISPRGVGIHFPSLDVDIHIPSLLRGQLGSQQWMEMRQEKGSA